MSEIEKLKNKAGLLGIDVDAFIEELVGLIGARVQVNTKQLAEDIAKAMPMPTVDVAQVAAQLKDMLPESAGQALDLVQLRADLETGLWGKLETKFNQVAGTLKERLEVIRKEGREGIDAAVEAKLLVYKDQMVAAVKAARAEAGGNGGGGHAAPNDKFGMAVEVIERIMDKQAGGDLSLDRIENLSSIYQRLHGLFGGQGGPNPDLQFKTVSEAYLEGRKHQHQWDIEQSKGGKTISPFRSTPPGGRSGGRRENFSRIDNAIRGL